MSARVTVRSRDRWVRLDTRGVTIGLRGWERWLTRLFDRKAPLQVFVPAKAVRGTRWRMPTWWRAGRLTILAGRRHEDPWRGRQLWFVRHHRILFEPAQALELLTVRQIIDAAVAGQRIRGGRRG